MLGWSRWIRRTLRELFGVLECLLRLGFGLGETLLGARLLQLGLGGLLAVAHSTGGSGSGIGGGRSGSGGGSGPGSGGSGGGRGGCGSITFTDRMFPKAERRNGSRADPYARPMSVETDVRPAGPYSLRLSARGGYGRSYRGGLFAVQLAIDGRVERAIAAQRSDGSLRLRAESEQGLERLRFVLAVDDDHSEFLRRYADDELVGRATRLLRGLRPVRSATVAHALLRAVVGQLITSSEARMIEGRVIRRAGCPPTAEALGRFSPAELQRLGLSARKATALVRMCRSLDLERLRDQPDGDALAARLLRERGIGPWSVGVVFMEGLGRFDRGIVRDLALIRLLSAIEGRWVEAEETDALLARYGEWQGIAAAYLLAGWGRDLVPVKATPAEVRHSRLRTRYRAA